MTVYFIGAGPGDPDLLTVRAAQLISQCQTCLYAGSIVPHEVLRTCPEDAHIVNTARMPLGDIVAELVAADQRGDDVARLHSGDTSIYSAVDEQIRMLDEHQIQWQIIPGVPAFSAAAAALGTELTIPHVSQSVILTRVDGRSTSMPDGEDLATVCASGATAVIHLAAAQMDRVVRELTPVYGKDVPVAVVAYASRSQQMVLRGTLEDIADQVTSAGITRTAVIVVGHILDRVDSSNDVRSFLYSDERPRDLHGRTVCGTTDSAAPPTADRTTGWQGIVAPGTTPSTNHRTAGPGLILVLGGTSEARDLADRLAAAGLEVVTSLAGRVKRPRLPRGDVRIGGFGGPSGLAHWLHDNHASAIIDATHPFAEQISQSAMLAAEETNIPLLRLNRKPWVPQDGDDWIVVPSMQDAAAVVRERFRRPMLTVGRQQLAAFAGDTRGSYLIRCVEPPEGPMPHRYLLVLDRGPFAVNSERILMGRHKIDVLVTKNSGGEATDAKLEAARALRIPVVMVQRPKTVDAETVHTVDDAAKWLVQRFGSR